MIWRFWGILGFGCLIATVFLLLMLTLWQDYRQLPSEPTPFTLADLAARVEDQRMYVTVVDGQWQCSSLRYSYSLEERARIIDGTQAILFNPERTVLAVTRFSGEYTCAELPTDSVSGIVTRIDTDARPEYQNFTADVLLELCAYCGPGNSLLGVLVSGVMMVIGISISVFALLMRRHLH